MLVLTRVIRWAAPYRAWIVRHRPVRWIVRRILMLHREGSVTEIHLGEAKGLRWRRSRRSGVAEYWLGTFEPLVQTAIAESLSPGDTFFDVGSNAGIHSLIGARAVGASGRVVAIDPDSANGAEIEAQAALNEFDQITVVRKAAVADHSQPLTWVDGGDVAQTTIDDLTQEFGPPTLIKIDVEGLELEVLRGASATLRDHRPTVVVEAHFSGLAGIAIARLAALGYRCVASPAPYGAEFHIVAKPA